MADSTTKAADQYNELTGVTFGTLAEDFLVTARIVGKPYCKVKIPNLGWTGDNYPLVYVPFLALGFSLKAGDPVGVKFSQDDLRFPYLWTQDPNTEDGATPFPIPAENAPVGSSGNVVFPSQSTDEYTFNILSSGLITASNGVYDCIRFGNQVQFFSADGMVLYSKDGDIGIKTSGSGKKVRIEAEGIELNGNTKQLVTWSALQSVLTSYDTAIKTALTTTPIVGNGSPQPTWTGLSLASLDISAAKTTSIKTGG